MDDKAKGGHKFYNMLLKSISLHIHLLFLLPVALILTFTSYNYYYLSAFVIPLFTHTFEKKYIFLLCTTILTFITKNINIFGLKEINVEHVLALDAPLVEGNMITIEQAPLEYEQESMEVYKETVEDNNNNITIEQAPEYEQESMEAYKEITMDDNIRNDEIERDNTEDDVEEKGCVDMDTEELNKKIEEFIRKMRQDLKLELEAKHQLITV